MGLIRVASSVVAVAWFFFADESNTVKRAEMPHQIKKTAGRLKKKLKKKIKQNQKQNSGPLDCSSCPQLYCQISMRGFFSKKI